MITISAGTKDKTSRVSSKCIADDGENDGYKLVVKNESIDITISSKGTASGGDYGEYGVTRLARATFPTKLIVEMVVESLMRGDYELNNTEVKKLLLAITSSMHDYSAPTTI